MNIFLLTDVEGIPNIDTYESIQRVDPTYTETIHNLTIWINKVYDYCKEAGADKVYYLDGHGGGGNVVEEEINKELIKCSIHDWDELLASGKIDCQIELGDHARAGTINGFLDHTMNSKKWFTYKINGVEQSELSLHAILCAQYNVPIVCTIGDKASCEQAKEYIPDIYTASVKVAECRNKAKTIDNPEKVVKEAVINSLKNYKKVSLYNIKFPATFDFTLYRTDFCEEVMGYTKRKFERIDARTLRKVEYEVKTYSDLKF